MYENKRQPLAPPATFFARIGKNLLVSILFLIVCLGIGTAGFQFTAPDRYTWIDCLHNASMLLSGMGPVITEFDTDTGKLFSSAYALFSGVAFITNIGFLLAPAVHRFFHSLHLEA
jgi:hypothetical protein